MRTCHRCEQTADDRGTVQNARRMGDRSRRHADRMRLRPEHEYASKSDPRTLSRRRRCRIEGHSAAMPRMRSPRPCLGIVGADPAPIGAAGGEPAPLLAIPALGWRSRVSGASLRRGGRAAGRQSDLTSGGVTSVTRRTVYSPRCSIPHDLSRPSAMIDSIGRWPNMTRQKVPVTSEISLRTFLRALPATPRRIGRSGLAR